MDDKFTQPQAEESDMQIGTERPAGGKEYTTIREIRVGFDSDSPRMVTATVATNRKNDAGELTDRGMGRAAELKNLAPEILAAIQVLSDAFAAELGV